MDYEGQNMSVEGQKGTDSDTDYARFHRLNDLAAEICATTDVSLLDMNNLK